MTDASQDVEHDGIRFGRLKADSDGLALRAGGRRKEWGDFARNPEHWHSCFTNVHGSERPGEVSCVQKD